MTTEVALTIAQVLDQPPLVPLWPTVGQALGQAESTVYQLAKEGRLPFECIRLGRRRYVRTVDLHRFLGLTSEGTAVAPGYQPGPSVGDDNAAGYQPAASVEQNTSASTSK